MAFSQGNLCIPYFTDFVLGKNNPAGIADPSLRHSVTNAYRAFSRTLVYLNLLYNVLCSYFNL